MARASKAALFSAILYNLAFPPINWALLVFVALVPWLLGLRGSTTREAFRSGFAFGAVIYVYQMHFAAVLTQRWTNSYALALLVWILCGLGGGLYFGCMALIYQRGIQAKPNLELSPWLFGALWIGLELARSYFPHFGFPWALIANPLVHTPFLAAAGRYLTVFGVGFLVVGFNCLLAQLAAGEHPSQLPWVWKPTPLLYLVACAFAWRQQTPVPNIAVAQLGQDIAYNKPDYVRSNLSGWVTPLLFKAAAMPSPPEAVLLPEGLASVDHEGVPFTVPPRLPVIFGAQHGSPTRQAAALLQDGRLAFADKVRLVVFGEYVPFRTTLPFISGMFGLSSQDMQPGDKPGDLQINNLKIRSLVCFEGLYPDMLYPKGYDAIVVLSLDDWFWGTGAVEQLRDSSRWRAIEAGVPLYRSSPYENSCITDSHGRILAQGRPGEATLLTTDRY